MKCKNCGHTIDGKYCSHCGQHSNVDRINLPNFLNEVSESVFQINKGFFYTLISLFFRPGKSIREFLNGKRKKHFKPIAYVLILSTLYFLITQITNQNTWMEDLLSGFVEGASEPNSEIRTPVILTWFSANFAYSTLILLPIFSLASYLSFLNFGANYIEHIVINSYVAGHQAIFYSLFALLGTVIESKLLESIPVLVAMSYTCWVFWKLFAKGNRVLNILRSFMTYFLYLFFSSVLLLAVMGISGF